MTKELVIATVSRPNTLNRKRNKVDVCPWTGKVFKCRSHAEKIFRKRVNRAICFNPFTED